MKNMSIKLKITIWMTILILVIALVSAGSVLYFSNTVVQRTMKRNLISAVESNFNEIQIHKEKDALKLDDELDISIEYNDLYIEIDDDFIREVDGVIISLYDNNSVLYGDSIIDVDNFELQEKGIRTVKEQNTRYYIYDKKIKDDDADSLWLRGIVSEELGLAQTMSVVNSEFFLIPLFVFIAILGAFMLAKRALLPIEKICSSANAIRLGSDLTKRIEIESSEKEVNTLVTSFNRMLERLESSFKKEQQFNSDVSHELRTPLSVILSQCELALEDNSTQEEYREALEVIQRQGSKLSKMINNMLEYARLENDNNINLERVDLSELVKSVCGDMVLIKENNIKLKADIDDGIYICADSELITRLLTNLISNAYKYGKENGNILVSLKTNEGNAVLSVKDDGIGISNEDINSIFDTFYRAEASRTKDGFGLGLSFVKRIAALHGGELSVISNVNEGSEFIFVVKILK